MHPTLRSRLAISAIASLLIQSFPPLMARGNDKAESNDRNTASPIKHVIVLIGENRTFDHVFATYVSPSGDAVSNLLSKGIVKADGTPGAHFGAATQFRAVQPFKTTFFSSLLQREKEPYTTLPAPTLNFAPTQTVVPPGTPLPVLAAIEPSLARISIC
jgi:phospholipase C